MNETAQAIAATLERALLPFGLDLVRAFEGRRYNEAIREHPALAPLELFGRPRALALLIGNSRALWIPLLARLRTDPELRQSQHPVDAYVESAVTAALAHVPLPVHIRYAHHRDERLVSMQHAAVASDLATLSPVQLCVHPELGPWFALRAVVVLDADLVLTRAHPGAPCQSCTKPCTEPFARALEAYRKTAEASVAASWEAWVAVRDACPVGRQERYHDEQIRYHYTKDLARLRALALQSTQPEGEAS